jgi:hypothetical protein
MTNLYARKLEKIFNKVGQIASKGRDNKLEYTKYIDELIEKGDFVAFQEMLNIFFQIDTLDVADVSDIKSRTWNEICFQTKSSFLQKLSKLYKQKKVYQQSYNIYSENNNIVSISISDKLTYTFSATGLTPSISFEKKGEVVDLHVYDDNITTIQIQKAVWEVGESGNEEPTNIKFFEDFQISYLANSFTTFNPSQLNIGDAFTMSVTTTKQYIPNQLISVTWSGNYIEGTVQSYDSITGDTVMTITDTNGSSTYSLWVVDYLSGPKSVKFKTSIPTTQGSTYLITTTEKNPINFDYKKYYYKLSLELNPLLGQIYEIDIYDPNSAYLVQNKQYARLTGERKAYLQAQKVGATFSVIFDVENPALSDETNLITRYSQAISYLLS